MELSSQPELVAKPLEFFFVTYIGSWNHNNAEILVGHKA